MYCYYHQYFGFLRCMGVTSSKTLLLKPNESVVTGKHYRSQIMGDVGINISLRIDENNSTGPHNSEINT